MYEDPSIARICDATVTMACLADMDSVFKDYSSLSAILTIKPETVLAQHQQLLELRIKDECREQLVFRTFDRAGKGIWTTNPIKGWSTFDVHGLIRKVSRLADMPSFYLYCLRRAVCNAINILEVTEADAQLGIGHRRGTSTYSTHYVSRETKIDFQGLITKGAQSTNLLVNCGITRSPYAELTPEEVEACEAKSEECVQLRGQIAAAKESIFSDHGSWTAAELAKDDRLKSYAKMVGRHSTVCKALRREAQREKSLQLKDANARQLALDSTNLQSVNDVLDEVLEEEDDHDDLND